MPSEVGFTCECCGVDGSPVARSFYAVTGHDGSVCVCSYCDDCASLARADWNGETKSIALLDPPVPS